PPPPGSPAPPPPSGLGLASFPFASDAASTLPPPPLQGGTSRGPVPLQPMRVGQTIDAAIKLYRSDWKTLMTIVALIAVPYTLLQDFIVHIATHPVLIGGRTYVDRADPGVAFVLVVVYYVLVSPLLKASMVRAVAGIYLGVRSTALESIRFGASKLG